MDWLTLPRLRDQYLRAADKLELLKEIEPSQSKAQKQLYAECWEIRRKVYPILVKARDEGRDIEAEAIPFNWSVAQIDDPILRDWLALYEIITI